MKKFLFSTTALAIAGAFAFSGDANAAAKPLKIGVGGFMTSEAGLGSNSGSFESAAGGVEDNVLIKRDNFNTVQDSEIYFTGSTKLDSGITVSVTVQLEGDQTRAGIIDESYMKLTGGFGDLRIGSVSGSNTVLKHLAPYVGIGLDGGSSDNYITVPAAVTASNSTNTSGSGDANKIVYISPVASGLRIGAAYTPSTTAGDGAPQIGGNGGTETQMYEGVLSFEKTLGTSSVKADIAYEHASGTSNNTHGMLRGGLNVSAGGVTVGGSISRRKNLNNAKNDTTNTDEQEAYDLGVSYTMGALKFGIATAVGTRATAVGDEDEESKWGVGMQYTMGPGVTTTLTYVHADYTDTAEATVANNNSGHALIGQIKVSF